MWSVISFTSRNCEVKHTLFWAATYDVEAHPYIPLCTLLRLCSDAFGRTENTAHILVISLLKLLPGQAPEGEVPIYRPPILQPRISCESSRVRQ